MMFMWPYPEVSILYIDSNEAKSKKISVLVCDLSILQMDLNVMWDIICNSGSGYLYISGPYTVAIWTMIPKMFPSLVQNKIQSFMIIIYCLSLYI